MESTRQIKVAKLIQKELAAVFQKKSRALTNGALITITGVNMSPDLSVAKVYLSMYPVKDKNAFLNAIKAQAKELRLELGNKVKNQLRIVPELVFYIDDSLDQVEKIEQLLKK